MMIFLLRQEQQQQKNVESKANERYIEGEIIFFCKSKEKKLGFSLAFVTK